jgi:hypothetical protein
MQRREQTGSAGAENQNVGLEPFEGHRIRPKSRETMIFQQLKKYDPTLPTNRPTKAHGSASAFARFASADRPQSPTRSGAGLWGCQASVHTPRGR